jgi:hypothetical protein
MSYTNGLDNPELYFQTKLYTGNGSTNAITFDGDENMQPDWVWVKDRGRSGYNHIANDVVIGVTKYLRPNLTNDEDTYTNAITSFDSDGFTLGSDASNGEHNISSQTYVAWNWKAGGSASSNSDGSITSSVSANTTAGFSIVSYTGTGTASDTVGHGLGATPAWIIVKNRTEATSWCVTHKSLTTDKVLRLEGTNAEGDIDSPPNNSSTFGFNNGTSGTPLKVVNESSDNYIAYCFAEKKGYSKFGRYTGNGNANGPFIYTGFKPAFVIQKRIDSSSNYTMVDNKRDVNNIVNTQVIANGNGAEFSENVFDFLSNGFKVRAVHGGYLNASGGSYIYMAFAESPFVNSNGVPTNAR